MNYFEYDTDYHYMTRCADCGTPVGHQSPRAVVVCAGCAVGDKPQTEPLFCPHCGTQRSRFDEGPCVTCARKKAEHDAYMVEHFGPDWRAGWERMRLEWVELSKQVWPYVQSVPEEHDGGSVPGVPAGVRGLAGRGNEEA